MTCATIFWCLLAGGAITWAMDTLAALSPSEAVLFLATLAGVGLLALA